MQSSGLTRLIYGFWKRFPHRLPVEPRFAPASPTGPCRRLPVGIRTWPGNPCPGPHVFHTHSYKCLLHTDPQRQGADTIC